MEEYKEFLEKMSLDKDCIQELLVYNLDKEEYKSYKKIFLEREEEFYRSIGENNEKLALYLYTHFAMDLKESIENNIKAYSPKAFDIEKIFFDTISDIKIWQEVYKRRSTKIGLIELPWVANSLKGRLFRLGRLQFEPDKDGKCVHIHIPEGDRLEISACEKSICMAKNFFNTYEYFDCLSWLLSPKILPLLGEKSGIRQFQSLFDIKEIRYDMKQATQRVLEDSPNVNESSLQRKLREYLKTNSDPGMGYGLKRFDD